MTTPPLTASALPVDDGGMPAQAGPKIIVALLLEPEAVVSSLNCARAVARGFNTPVTAIHVGFNPQFTFVPPEEVAIQRMVEVSEGTVEDRRQKTRQAYDAWVAGSGRDLTISWKEAQGNVGDLVAEETASADLVVMGNPQRLDGRDAFHSTLFWSKRLLLVAPPSRKGDPDFDPQVIGRHMVIGWKPGEAVERAVEHALPWLRRAEKVSVLCVRDASDPAYEMSARAYFASLDLPVKVIGLDHQGPSVGRQLLEVCRRQGGDSLLIGAFKHGALWEAILGGVTRDVLAAARCPVFMMC